MGHATQGESALVLLYDGDEVVYSCVVDSFMLKDQTMPKVLLQGLGITHITDLFWTHPHDDHAMGISTLIDEFTPDCIYVPSELHSLPSSTVSNEVLQKINTINGYDRRVKNHQKVISIGVNNTIHYEVLQVGAKIVPFEVFTVAPSIGKVRWNVIDNAYNSLNDFSIVLSIVIGDFSILLTGDIQNRMIRYVNDDLCKDIPSPNLLKIPHHGSKDSTSIFDLFGGDIIDMGVTTAKSSSRLPRQEALDIYSERCQHLYRIDPDSSECAVWGISVDILKGTIDQIADISFVQLQQDTEPKVT